MIPLKELRIGNILRDKASKFYYEVNLATFRRDIYSTDEFHFNFVF